MYLDLPFLIPAIPIPGGIPPKPGGVQSFSNFPKISGVGFLASNAPPTF